MIKDNKIEIFTGINDTPTPPSATTGCNGSYLVDRFNRVVDQASASLDYPTESRGAQTQIYVDMTNGDDAATGASDAPVKTIKKAIELISAFIAPMGAEIMLSSDTPINLMDELIFDFRSLKTFFISEQYERWRTGIVISRWYRTGNSGILKYNTLSFNNLSYDGQPWIILPMDGSLTVTFLNWTFQTDAYSLPILGDRVRFMSCIFEGLSTAWGALLWFQDVRSPILLNNCSFKAGAGNYIYINFYCCDIPYIQLQWIYEEPILATLFEVTNSRLFLDVGGSATMPSINEVVSSFSDSEIWLRYNRMGENEEMRHLYPSDLKRIYRAQEYRDNSNNRLLTSRQSAIPNATSGTEIATINAILTALRNHGLINT